jgi:N-carbamoyl-L-amino-acid hydrolase
VRVEDATRAAEAAGVVGQPRPSEIAHGRLTGLDELHDTGRDAKRGGYSRHIGEPAELELRSWFVERAVRLGLGVEIDRNGNLWAWWGEPGADAVVTGSHLDSVPGGGEFDGPLGVVSALDAVARLQATGFAPSRPCAIVVFAEEEGSRFGVPCLGSRLMTGTLSKEKAGALRDAAGISFAEAAPRLGIDPERIGRDAESLSRIGVFIELHVEQGRGLIDLGAPLAVASAILAHGRWRLTFTGEGNHAGATPMPGRSDPMVAASKGVLSVQELARRQSGSRATVGRLEANPGGTNVIPSTVTAWLDARAETDEQTQLLVDEITVGAAEAAESENCRMTMVEESWSGTVVFDPALRNRLASIVGDVPALASGAGHDAGILAGTVPTAMLFVRNPTGVSHAPEEWAELDDTLAGIDALEKTLRALL